MSGRSNQTNGILLMVATTFIFAVQDGFSRHLAAQYPVIMVVMLRYWFFAAFVMAITARSPGGIRAAARSKVPLLQIFRGALLVLEICVAIWSFVLLGLVEAHAIFACYPLIIAALSGPVLGEAVGWKRWAAIGVGFIGILVILRPGFTVFSPEAVVPLVAAAMFALYGLLTRYVGRIDRAATSFFWTGMAGAVVITVIGIWSWEPMASEDWGLMGVLCITGALGHWMLIKVYDLAEASAVQPFAYFQLVFASTIGVMFFSETLSPLTVLGATIVVGAGLFTFWREGRSARLQK